MRNDDQWFEPGDKVMRVQHQCPDGVSSISSTAQSLAFVPYGKVLCVEYCEKDEGVNWVHFCGFPSIRAVAANFRKVEEIQLCVRAAEAMKTPKKQEELV